MVVSQFELNHSSDGGWYLRPRLELRRNHIPRRRIIGAKVRLMSLFLLALNVIGPVVYVYRASPSWAIPQERGLVPITGEPVVWFAGILPVITIFFVLNVTWGGTILLRKQWRSVYFWQMAAAVWLIAVCVDFAHH